jgi:hypothetical protein
VNASKEMGIMKEKIIARILRTVQVPDLLEVLTQRLSQSDLQSLLLEVYRKRAHTLTPRHLLQGYEQNRFVQPAAVNPKQLLEFDRLAYSVLPSSFELLELSPVCPLGTNSVMAPVDQDNAVTTIRNTEVCSDSTNVLALECARRRRAGYRGKVRPEADTKLCASHRLLRPHLPDDPASFPHFRIFSLCTAGRDVGSYGFEVRALREHLEFYVRLLQSAQQAGFKLEAVRTRITVFDETCHDILKAKVLDELSRSYSKVEFKFNQEQEGGQGYYAGVRFQMYARDQAGTEYFMVDGGFTDWTQQLLSNRKERLLISGMGSERFISCFG